jgi:hypothetical protein
MGERSPVARLLSDAKVEDRRLIDAPVAQEQVGGLEVSQTRSTIAVGEV